MAAPVSFSTSPVRPLWQSRLGYFLLLAGVLLLQIKHNGYSCFRSDHLTQIPLLFMQQDPSLFPRDWFLQNYAHFDVRFFHLLLLNAFAWPLGLPVGILVLYVILILATLWAWGEIARRLYGSPLPGLVAGVMAAWLNGVELGSNHLLENIMIPRTEAYAFAYWGLLVLLLGRPFLAGLLLALGGYFQPAVGILFALPMLVWLLLPRDTSPWRARLKQAGRFAAGLGLASLVPVYFLRHGGVLDSGSLPAGDYIHLAAYIRHPHHMLPHLWGSLWLEFAALFLLFYVHWRDERPRQPQAWAFGLLAPVMMGLLAIGTIFIEWLPVKSIVLLQPYRMAVLLYFVIALFLAPHVLALLRGPGALARARGFFFILALPYWAIFVPFALVEVLLVLRQKAGRPLPDRLAAPLFLAALAIPLMLVAEPKIYRHDLKDALLTTLLLVATLIAATRFRLLERPRLLKGLLASAALAGLLFASAFFWLPLERWMTSGPAKYQKKLGSLCYQYQFNPIALKGVERVAVWASKNTPKDALFIIPPERQPPGFHIWSKRSAFFSIKFFPYTPKGLMEWRERFLVVHGVLETKTVAGQMALNEAMDDMGGGLMDKSYDNLTANQICQVADKYGAGYIITQTRYRDPRLIRVHEDYDLTKSRDNSRRKPFYLYRIQSRPAVAVASSPQHEASPSAAAPAPPPNRPVGNPSPAKPLL